MAVARFKDLCIDASDAHRLGDFWGTALSLRLVDHDDGDAQLDGDVSEERIWINTVPEPKTVKHRVHLDVPVGDVAELLAAGATVLREPDDEIRWTVMADPEGGEFCAFVRQRPPHRRFLALVVDADDAQQQARWWHEVLGGREPRRYRAGSWGVADIPDTPFEELLFLEVPEPKTVKNRIHWDVESTDHDRLGRLGARVLREPDGAVGWHVYADPEGNEFCVFAPRG
ncbi:MAG: VOC family protein [Micromonosporaceae bacterium]